jgi:hypothetical protein
MIFGNAAKARRQLVLHVKTRIGRGRPAAGGGARSLRGPAAVQEVADDRKDDECRLAHQAFLLRRVRSRPDDQSGPGALHGKADGREDGRDQCEPPVADFTTRCDLDPDSGGTRRLRPQRAARLGVSPDVDVRSSRSAWPKPPFSNHQWAHGHDVGGSATASAV